MEVQEENNKIGSDIGKEKRCKTANCPCFGLQLQLHLPGISFNIQTTHKLEDTKAQGVMFLKCSSLSRDLVVLSPFKASKTALQSEE